MKSVQIFLHSVRQVTGNLGEALRVSLVPYAIQMAVALILFGPIAIASHEPALRLGAEGEAQHLASALLVVFTMVVTSIWTAIAWHRFVLKGESPSGWLPGFTGGRSWGYFLRSLGIVLICFGAAIPLGVGVAVIGATFADQVASPNLFEAVLSAFLVLPITYISYRMSAALPAPALDKTGLFSEGWKATSGDKVTVLGLSFISTVLLSGLPFLASLILGDNIVLAVLWELVFGWLELMIGLSVLTTLYGHYIEGRPLV